MNDYLKQHKDYLKNYLHDLLDLKIKLLLENNYNKEQIKYVINKIHNEENNLNKIFIGNEKYTVIHFYVNLQNIFKAVHLKGKEINDLIIKYIFFNTENNNNILLSDNTNYKKIFKEYNDIINGNNKEFIVGYTNEEQEKGIFYKSINEVEYNINNVNNSNINNCIYSVIDNIKFLNNNQISKKIVFNDFQSLSNLLNELNLNGRVQENIIFNYLKLNIDSKIFSDDYIIAIDEEDIVKHNFSYFNGKEILKLVQSGKIIKYLTPTIFNKKAYMELKNFIEKYITYNSNYYENLCNIYNSLNEHYYKSNLNELDISVIIEELKKLNVSDISINKIKCLLLKQIDKKNESISTPFKLGKISVGKKINICDLSNKEYNLIIKELKKYVDLETMQLIKPVNYEKQLYLISLLIKLKIDDSKINCFINNCNKKINIIDNFTSIIAKLEYYSNFIDISNDIEDLKECYIEYKETNNI